MSRDPEIIQRDIDVARVALGNTLDQIVERTNPKRLAAEGKVAAQAWVVSPTGKKVIGGTVAVIAALIVLRRIRSR